MQSAYVRRGQSALYRPSMLLFALFSALHLLTLALGAGSLFVRGRAFRTTTTTLSATQIRAALTAHSVWWIAIGSWLFTGLLRWLWLAEKPVDYYLRNPVFHAKLTLFLIVLLAEIYPSLTLAKWSRTSPGEVPTAVARALWRVNHVQLLLVVVIVFLASLAVRGVGLR